MRNLLRRTDADEPVEETIGDAIAGVEPSADTAAMAVVPTSGLRALPPVPVAAEQPVASAHPAPPAAAPAALSAAPPDDVRVAEHAATNPFTVAAELAGANADLKGFTWIIPPSGWVLGSLTITAGTLGEDEDGSAARHLIERVTAWITGDPRAHPAKLAEGDRVRFLVVGRWGPHGVPVELSVLLPRDYPLTSTQPPTEAFTAVPEATPASEPAPPPPAAPSEPGGSHPYPAPGLVALALIGGRDPQEAA